VDRLSEPVGDGVDLGTFGHIAGGWANVNRQVNGLIWTALDTSSLTRNE
jgi:hypothetical protein